jgi:dihydrofolate reductase
MLNRISLDGFFAGPHGEMNWFVQDPDIEKADHERMRPDTLLLGRKTYQLFEKTWPPMLKDPKTPPSMKKIAQELQDIHKIVFSKTLKEVTWENTTLIKRDIVPTVKKLKKEKGNDIAIFGSGTIVQQLAEAGLIDEYLFTLTPVVLGEGKALFKDVDTTELKLLETKAFKSGNTLLHYAIP